jgi:hypothetical protein
MRKKRPLLFCLPNCDRPLDEHRECKDSRRGQWISVLNVRLFTPTHENTRDFLHCPDKRQLRPNFRIARDSGIIEVTMVLRGEHLPANCEIEIVLLDFPNVSSSFLWVHDWIPLRRRHGLGYRPGTFEHVSEADLVLPSVGHHRWLIRRERRLVTGCSPLRRDSVLNVRTYT